MALEPYAQGEGEGIMWAKLAQYKKTIAAVIIGILGWSSAVVASDSASITSTEWIMLATAVVTAAGVFTWANAPAQ